MKAIVIWLIVTLLVFLFARPNQIAALFNKTDRITVEKSNQYYKALTGLYPSFVPLVLLGTTRDDATNKLEADLATRGIPFTYIDTMSNPQARPIMNEIGFQNIPTTIVGTHIISGANAGLVEKTLLDEQKELHWPALYRTPSTSHAANHSGVGKTPHHIHKAKATNRHS